MSPKKGVVSRTALLAAILALATLAMMPQSARAQATDFFAVTHFDTNRGDGVVRTINPTFSSSPGILCEMIYVFDAHEELQECCGCPVTNNGLRTLSTLNDLTKNPLTGPNTALKTGVIKIVSAAVNSSSPPYAPCNPAVNVVPTPTLLAWSTHVYANAVVGITETKFEDSPLSMGTGSELDLLTSTCAFIHTNGTGSGICTCGVGDNAPAPAGAGGR